MAGDALALDRDQTLGVLRSALVAAAANAHAFTARGQLGAGLLSARSWGELAEIEAEFGHRLEQVLRRELRIEAWSSAGRLRSWLRGQRDLWSGERPTLERQLREAASLPVRRWRAGTPQLEASLWPFFEGRTEHLANSMALGLGEPAPFPAIIWHPGRREFRR